MAQQFYVKINNVVDGPLSGQTLQEMAQSGQLSPDDEVRLATSKAWVPAGNIKGLQFATAQAAPEVLARLAEEEPQENTQASYSEPEEGFPDMGVGIPDPPAYPAISFFIGLYNFFGFLIVVVAIILFLVSILFSINQMNILIGLAGVLGLIGYLFVAALCFFSAQLLGLAADSARNIHRLTHSNLIIMQSIRNNKK